MLFSLLSVTVFSFRGGVRNSSLGKKYLKAVPGHTVVGINSGNSKPAHQFPPTGLGEIFKQIGARLI